MIEIKSPNRVPAIPTVRAFLAGSIEMGAAINWQKLVVDELSDLNVTFLNPRRDDWDVTWEQSIDHPRFVEQVTWELFNIENANIVVFYFDPATKSPVTLMELGFMLRHAPENCIVCCPHGFWRKGNVDIMCDRHRVPVYATMPDFTNAIRRRLYADIARNFK